MSQTVTILRVFRLRIEIRPLTPAKQALRYIKVQKVGKINHSVTINN